MWLSLLTHRSRGVLDAGSVEEAREVLALPDQVRVSGCGLAC